MGLFSFIGKAIKAVSHAIPFVGPAVDVLNSVMPHKTPMGTTATKISVLGRMPVSVLRSKSSGSVMSPARVLSSSPVMPGGGIASSAGIMAPGGGLPPASFGGRSSGGRKRKRKSVSRSHKRSSRKRSTGKRKSKLKFGSAAYRKKYLGHR